MTSLSWSASHASTEEKRVTINDLPKWEARKLTFSDADDAHAVLDEADGITYWASINADGKVGRMISNLHKLPSKVYKNISPIDFVTLAMRTVRDMYDGFGDVSIRSVASNETTGKLLVTIKCPHVFSLASNASDRFGTTMVLRNSYRQESGMTVAAGAIRFACTNGCIYGDCNAVSWTHRDGEDKLVAHVQNVMHSHVDKARAYMARLEGVRIDEIVVDPSSANATMEWRTGRMLQDITPRDVTLLLVANLPITFCDKRKVVMALVKAQKEKRDEMSDDKDATLQLTLYDLWNACTSVASRKVEKGGTGHGRRGSGVRVVGDQIGDDAFLTSVNLFFTKDKAADKIMAWTTPEADAFVRAWLEQGWQKHWWTPVGPTNCAKRARAVTRDEGDAALADITDDDVDEKVDDVVMDEDE